MSQPRCTSPLPQYRSVAMEQDVLGSIMVGGSETLQVVRRYLHAEDFGLPERRRVFEAMCALEERGVPPNDSDLLIKELEKKRRTAAQALEDLAGLYTDNYLNVAHYCMVMLEAALKSARFQRAQWYASLIEGDSAEAAAGIAAEEKHIADLERRLRGEGNEKSGWQPTVQTLDDLMRRELSPVRWAVEEIIGEGVTLLAAKPKKGKTVFMLQIAMCVANGTKAIGGHAQTQQGEVLYLALEENERRMQRRAEKILMGERAPKGVHLVYDWPQFTNGGVEALSQWMDEHSNTRLIVIDTLERVRPTRRGNGNIYAEDYAAVKDIQRFAGQRQVAVVVIHHTGKSGREDPLDEVSGSTGLTGGVDNILVMRALNGLTELHRQGRDYTDNSAIALRGDPETLLWTYAGNADEVRRSDARKAILDLLKDGPSDGMYPREIADALGQQSGAIRFLLHKMMKADDGCITKVKGKYAATTNVANIANDQDQKQPGFGKQAGAQSTGSVSDSVSGTTNANAPANAQIPLEFSPVTAFVSDVSTVSTDGHICTATGGAHVYELLRTPDGRRICVECERPETREVAS